MDDMYNTMGPMIGAAGGGGAQAQYASRVDELWGLMTDLQVSDAQIHQVFNMAMALRSNIRGRDAGVNAGRASGVYTPGRGGGATVGVRASRENQNSYSDLTMQDIECKQILSIALQKRFKVSSIKDLIAYSSEQVEIGGYRGVVEGSGLQSAYEGFAETKKDAEHAAARTAILAEFPEAVQATSAQRAVVGRNKPAPVDAQQQKAESQAEPKGRLGHFMQCLLDRTLTKQDIVYSTEVTTNEQGQSAYVSVVTLPATIHTEQQAFQGEIHVRQQDAEKSAAAEAVAALEEIAQPLAEEKAERKRAKDSEHRAEKRRKLEEEQGVAGGS